MQKLTTLILMTLISVTVWGQSVVIPDKNTNDTPIKHENGRVGVGTGTSVPSGVFNILGGNGGYSVPTLRLQSNSTSYQWSLISLYSDNTNDYMIGRGATDFFSGRALSIHVPSRSGFYSNSGEHPKIAFLSSGRNLLGYVESTTGNWYMKGNVGIGTTTPGAPITVTGNSEKLNILRLENGMWKCNQEMAIEFWNGTHYKNVPTSRIVSKMHNCGEGGEDLLFQTQTPSTNNPNQNDPTTKLIIGANGNVGIGTTNPGTNKLAVNGTIKAKEIKVDITGWSDFVFANDYLLKPLAEVEAFITKNNHLPDVPNEAEVKANGVYLGEMDAKLLQKIEELTLYAIQKEKEVQELKAKVQSQNEKVETLEDRLAKIEEMLLAK